MVENLVLTGKDIAIAQAPSGTSLAAWSASVDNAVKRFSTPNARLSRELLLHVGFDPASLWKGMKAPGPTRGGGYEEQLLAWLRVRHAIAHGDAVLPSHEILAHVREVKKRQLSAGVALSAVQLPDHPGLRLTGGTACAAFVNRIARAAGRGFADAFNLDRVKW